MTPDETKQHKARQMRYKKAIVKDLNYAAICEGLYEIMGECEEVRWYFDGDDDTLINALSGNEDEAFEFRMMFADLCAECEQMQDDLRETWIPECFDDLFVAAGAAEYADGMLGYDAYEQDYYGLGRYESDWAEGESRKRLLRLTKDQLVDAVHACLNILYAYLGIRYRYDCLKASMDILRDQNTGYLQMVKQIEELYEKCEQDDFRDWGKPWRQMESLIAALPDEAWLQ